MAPEKAGIFITPVADPTCCCSSVSAWLAFILSARTASCALVLPGKTTLMPGIDWAMAGEANSVAAAMMTMRFMLGLPPDLDERSAGLGPDRRFISRAWHDGEHRPLRYVDRAGDLHVGRLRPL